MNELRVSAKIAVNSTWNFVADSGLGNFAAALRSCCQQNSSMTVLVDVTCDARCLSATSRSSVETGERIELVFGFFLSYTAL